MSFAPGRLEAALRYADALPDERARRVARDVAARILELHREGLSRIMAALREAGEPGRQLLQHVSTDDVIASLLALHDLQETPPRVDHATCDLCAQPLADRHTHLLRLTDRRLVCACDACAVLLDTGDTPGARYRRIRPRLARLDGLRFSEAAWRSLGVPVALAFFTRSSMTGDVVAAYPGPAGAVESIVDPAAWDGLLAEHPELRDLEPDVEALLVNRLGTEPQHFRLSIDRCYELAGLVRSSWRGITGGSEVAGAIEHYFSALHYA